MQVMLSRASQEGPFSAQSAKHMVLATAQDGNDLPKATVSRPFWARKRRHAHDVGKNRVAKMCSLLGRVAHYHNFPPQKSKEKRAKRHQKRNQHKKFKEMAKMKNQI